MDERSAWLRYLKTPALIAFNLDLFRERKVDVEFAGMVESFNKLFIDPIVQIKRIKLAEQQHEDNQRRYEDDVVHGKIINEAGSKLDNEHRMGIGAFS